MSDDAISRQAAIEKINEYIDEYSYVDAQGNHELKWCAMQEAKMMLKDLPPVTPKQSGWIPVSERLPDDHDWYVIVVKEKSTGYQYIPRIASHNHDNCWSIIDTEDADKDWLDDLECVAWMPLPEPYKAESEEQA